MDDHKHGNIKKIEKKEKRKKKTGLNVLELCKKLEIVKGIKTPIYLIWLLPFALITTNPISSFVASFALAH